MPGAFTVQLRKAESLSLVLGGAAGGRSQQKFEGEEEYAVWIRQNVSKLKNEEESLMLIALSQELMKLYPDSFFLKYYLF